MARRLIVLQVTSKRYNGIMEVSAVAVTKEELYKLIERIEDPIELESAYVAVKSIVEHDDQAWYWTERWQQEEAEADKEKASGQRIGPMSAAEALSMLDRIIEQNEKNG